MTAPDDPIQLVQGAGFSSWDEIEHSLRTVAGVLPLPLKPLTPAITVGVATAPGTRRRSATALIQT